MSTAKHGAARGRQNQKKKRAYDSEIRAQSKLGTREALLSAALELFAEKGLDGPSIDEICTRAGYTRGAFYAHFGDRDTLISEAMRSRRKATLGSLVSGLGEEPRITGLISLLGSLVDANVFPPKEGIRTPEFVQACRRSPSMRRAHLTLLDETKTHLASLIEEAKQRREVRKDAPVNTLALLLVVFEAGVEVMADLEFRYPAQEVANLLVALISTDGRIGNARRFAATASDHRNAERARPRSAEPAIFAAGQHPTSARRQRLMSQQRPTRQKKK